MFPRGCDVMRYLRSMLWLLLFLPFALGAAEGGEAERLRRENSELRAELLKLRNRLRDQELFLAAAADEGEFTSVKEREARLLTKLSLLCSDGDKLAVRIKELADEVRQVLRDLPVEAAQRARLRMLLDDLERQAGAFAALIDDPVADPAKAFRECRVLEVNRELEVVLLDLGARQGAFVGLVLRGGADKGIELRLDEVRSGVSAATVQRGKLRDIVPGMRFSAETRVKR